MQFLTNERFGDGRDGDLVVSANTTDAPIDSAGTGTVNTNTFSATNVSFAVGQIVRIQQMKGTGAGQWEYNVITGYVPGTVTLKYKLSYEYISGAQIMVVKQYRNVTVESGKTLTVKTWDGSVGAMLDIFANGKIQVIGTIAGGGVTGATTTASEPGFTSGGGFRGGTSRHYGLGSNVGGYQGEGIAGGMGSTYDKSGNAGGGGYVANSGPGDRYGCPGGGGGNGAVGTDAANYSGGIGGKGGDTSGNASLTLMTPGGGGGGGALRQDVIYQSGCGGSGGAMVTLVAPTIVVSGPITLGGGNGGNGGYASPGGGGAGGSCLLKGRDITLGSNLITAPGGTGGTSDSNGGNGGVGRIHADYSNSITGTTSPTCDTTKTSVLASPFFGGVV